MAHLPGGTRTLSRTTDANLDSELIKSALVLSCSNKMGDHSYIGSVLHFTTRGLFIYKGAGFFD